MQSNQSQLSPEEINEKLVNKLLIIFALINDWLKYAEAKNALIIAFCGASITAIITYLSAVNTIIVSIELSMKLSLVFFGFSSVFAIISFLPKTDSDTYFWKLFHKSKNMIPDTSKDSFYFFGHLRKYVELKNKQPNPDKLLDAITQYYLHQNPISYTKEARDICIQIINNSDITLQKFILSAWSVRFALCAIAITPVCMVISLILYHHL
ncbi:hypothetical protein [Anabaena sp. CA = ATCC 33047]|uniref:hypothetical protein n=1 Tax=Anabaena sp. (strain CA / ATCC 33047) TaxID=52271 RepID=UPI00082D00E2|nr:hypothetical protein [Anabaena sp. CA = ATCC 33047]